MSFKSLEEDIVQSNKRADESFPGEVRSHDRSVYGIGYCEGAGWGREAEREAIVKLAGDLHNEAVERLSSQGAAWLGELISKIEAGAHHRQPDPHPHNSRHGYMPDNCGQCRHEGTGCCRCCRD